MGVKNTDVGFVESVSPVQMGNRVTSVWEAGDPGLFGSRGGNGMVEP